eukprot:CAMPEP_0203753950 /NCGR_PEP_ID=MMETSP0098-20131031/7632_1 /ASSEMBLY_ACC=CAM_ASM_000208 /TAXON_ID=96639 /ORGANISM=" , Strain NY0313808BC1" /LENGTH=216 /DNA_ID=CAMNT_0050644773 /DNA_START=1171 /DNA_END=1818 /DNA_ORIENTATION=+
MNDCARGSKTADESEREAALGLGGFQDKPDVLVPRQQGLCDRPASEQAHEFNKKDAVWFMHALESYQLDSLSSQQKQLVAESQLRHSKKYRESVLFREDVEFISNTDISVGEAPISGNIGKQLVRRASSIIVKAYKDTLYSGGQIARGNVWAALMERVRYLLQRSGYEATILMRDDSHHERTLSIMGYRISRSNLRKQFLEFLHKHVDDDKNKISD